MLTYMAAGIQARVTVVPLGSRGTHGHAIYTHLCTHTSLHRHLHVHQYNVYTHTPAQPPIHTIVHIQLQTHLHTHTRSSVQFITAGRPSYRDLVSAGAAEGGPHPPQDLC